MRLTPQVSVVIPLHNGETFLEQTLQSVRTQEFADWELIVVDDGSTDTSPKIVERFAQGYRDRVSLIKQDNRGGASARNTGAAAAKGEYIAFLDADDLWHPSKLRLQLRALHDDPELIGVSSGYHMFKSDRPQTSVKVSFSWEFEDVLRWMLGQQRGPAFNSSFMVRSSTFHSVDGYDENLRFAEDLDLAWRLANSGPITSIPAFLTFYREWTGQIHRDVELQQKNMRYVYAKYFSANPDFLALANSHLDLVVGVRRIRKGEWKSGLMSLLGTQKLWPSTLATRMKERAIWRRLPGSLLSSNGDRRQFL